MNTDFQIADLSKDQREKLNQMEDELGVVLIAWSKEDQDNHPVNDR